MSSVHFNKAYYMHHLKLVDLCFSTGRRCLLSPEMPIKNQYDDYVIIILQLPNAPPKYFTGIYMFRTFNFQINCFEKINTLQKQAGLGTGSKSVTGLENFACIND